MDKIEAKLAEIKAKIQAKLNKIKEIKADKVADLLTISALIIIFGTTFALNRYVGMYLLAIELLIISYFIAKGGAK